MASANPPKKILPNSVALAGEYAVLSQLMLRGYVASLTMGNTKSIDIVVYDPQRRRHINVEVKTNLERRTGPRNSTVFGRFVTDWRMGRKHEDIIEDDLFYCFVNMYPDTARPNHHAFRFFIVPSRKVAEYLYKSHRRWLKADAAHKDTDIRLFKVGLPNELDNGLKTPLADEWEDNWNFSQSPRGSYPMKGEKIIIGE